jgi:hypothetical protein
MTRLLLLACLVGCGTDAPTLTAEERAPAPCSDVWMHSGAAVGTVRRPATTDLCDAPCVIPPQDLNAAQDERCPATSVTFGPITCGSAGSAAGSTLSFDGQVAEPTPPNRIVHGCCVDGLVSGPMEFALCN